MLLSKALTNYGVHSSTVKDLAQGPNHGNLADGGIRTKQSLDLNVYWLLQSVLDEPKQ